MSAAGVSYDWTVEGKIPGVTEAISKLDMGIASITKLEVATKSYAAVAKASVASLDDLTAAHWKQTNAKNWLANAQSALSKKSMEFTSTIQAGHQATKDVPAKISEGFKGVGQTVSAAKSSVSAFFEFTGGLLALEIIKKIGQAVAGVVENIVAAAGASEKMALSLKLNVGVQGAKDVTEWIDKIASKTKFTGDELSGWANQLLRSGVNSKDIVKYMAASLDLAARGADMGSAVNTLGMASLKGEIGAKSLLGLGIRPEQIAELPGYKGLSKAELEKKIDAGSITMPQVMKIIRGKDGVLGDEGVQAGNLLEAKIKNIKELPGNYYQQFAGTPAFDKLKSKLDEAFQSLDPQSERGKRLFASMDRLFTVMVDKFAKIDFEKLANGLEKFVDVLFKIGKITGAMVDIASGSASGAGKVAGAAFDGATLLPKFLYGAGADGVSMVKHGVDVVKGFAKGIEAGAPQAQDAARGMVVDTSDAVTTKAEIQSPSKLFARHGKNIALGFAMGIDSGQAGIDAAMDGAFSVPAPQGGRGAGVGAMGSPNITIEVNVSGHQGAGGDEMGRSIATEVARIIPSALIDAFEQLGLAAGAT